jgi:hypothetical protein
MGDQIFADLFVTDSRRPQHERPKGANPVAPTAGAFAGTDGQSERKACDLRLLEAFLRIFETVEILVLCGR